MCQASGQQTIAVSREAARAHHTWQAAGGALSWLCPRDYEAGESTESGADSFSKGGGWREGFSYFLVIVTLHFRVYRVHEEFRGCCEELPVSRYKGETIAFYSLGRRYL